MKPAQQITPRLMCQTAMALDGMDLREITPADRNAAVCALASLLLEAAGVPVREARNDHG